MPEYRINQIEDALRELHRDVSGLQASVVVSLDGFVVAAHVPDGNSRRRATGAADSPQVAAMAASIIALSDRVLAQLQRGAISRILIDGTEGGTVVIPAGRDAALAAMINADAKLGLVMLALRRSAAQVSHILSPGS
jgi:predicted regulator of Ras-like GTPase activity (Roadblock/LC7/MglB family)